MRVGYLINQYPLVSHSFVRREIAALEAAGVDVARYSLRPVASHLLADPADAAEASRTRAVLGVGPFGLLGALLAAAAARPGRFAAALRGAVRLGRRSDGGTARHLIYLAEACVLLRWLESGGAEHLHAHFGTNSATVALLCRLLGGPPFSFTVHGPEEFDRPASIGLGEKIERAAFVAGVSSFGRSQLMRWCGHEHWAKIHVIHCGLDRVMLDRDRDPLPTEARLVCLGRLCEQKGQLLLIEAAARLVAEGVDLELVLVGDGELREPIEALIQRFGLGDRVTITGWQSGSQVAQWIGRARAMVLPSFAEGLPVAIMEALALGRPVISTNVAGIPELVDDDCGWLVPAGSTGALVAAMREALAAGPDRLEQMARVGAARVRRRHDVRQEAERLAALFAGRAPAERRDAPAAGAIRRQAVA